MAYATFADYQVYGMRTQALGPDVTTEIVQSHLQSNSDQLDIWLEQLGGYKTPLSSWGQDLTRAICQMTSFTIMSSIRGYNPEGPDVVIKQLHDQAIKDVQYMAVLGSPHLVDGT